ncbi:hypothetical protein QYE80_16665 [Pseudomonas tohonis]|uniref:hypothetical protein n=1 Tax=Pseudomonas solani TaxID=2731552 RepID=UPI000396BDF2|nr:hypothetical protein L682_07335 [Pseudomonas alcaligenes OT 69]MDN4146627.1 hypothetical protein [Pseudomonas tohonis]
MCPANTELELKQGFEDSRNCIAALLEIVTSEVQFSERAKAGIFVMGMRQLHHMDLIAEMELGQGVDTAPS